MYTVQCANFCESEDVKSHLVTWRCGTHKNFVIQHCGWASEILHLHLGWWKAQQNHGMLTTYQLVIGISLAHPQC